MSSDSYKIKHVFVRRSFRDVIPPADRLLAVDMRSSVLPSRYVCRNQQERKRLLSVFPCLVRLCTVQRGLIHLPGSMVRNS